MKNKKFDPIKSLQYLFEQEDEEQSQPESKPEMPESAPNQQQQSQNVFRDIIGGTISDISFKKVGENGGTISILTSNSHIPLLISWINNKVTARTPGGNVIVLSE